MWHLPEEPMSLPVWERTDPSECLIYGKQWPIDAFLSFNPYLKLETQVTGSLNHNL